MWLPRVRVGGSSVTEIMRASSMLARAFPAGLASARAYTAPALVLDEAVQPDVGRHHFPAATPSWADASLTLPSLKALLVDAAGTLLSPSEPAAEVYLRYARKYGVRLSKEEVLHRFRRAYNTPWGNSTLRYVGDARPFWHHIVTESTGCDSSALSEELYQYYARGEAWFVSPGAVDALQRIRNVHHMKTAVVSNFDTRLRKIMLELGLTDLFDVVVVSAEEGVEKPNPRLFEAACEALGVPPNEAIHLGDDRRNDVYGARDAGCFAWLWGADVHNFSEVERRLETGNLYEDF